MTGESLNFESKCKTPSRPNYVNLPTRLTSKRWFRAREETGRGIWLGAVPPLLTLSQCRCGRGSQPRSKGSRTAGNGRCRLPGRGPGLPGSVHAAGRLGGRRQPLRPGALGARPGQHPAPLPFSLPGRPQPGSAAIGAPAPPDSTFWKAESERLNARDTQRDRDSIAEAAGWRAGGHRI